MENKKEWQEELLHLQKCLRIISENTSYYEQEYSNLHIKVQELHKAINSGDKELYNQLMTVSSLEDHAAAAFQKNQAALTKPYFGKINYLDIKRERNEVIYIGKNGIFKSKTEVLIADWRAPISSVYYENELGEGEYGLPDEPPIPIHLSQKRTFDISNGELKGYYDSDVASNDALLIQYLSRNKDVVLGEIIATIQKEQNSIIRESPFSNIIVQGVAGSGKTTVAMHRISYILYNYKHRFESNEFCIVGSSDILLNYITSGLPELDVPNIKHLRMDQILSRLCEKGWQKKNKFIPIDYTAPKRSTLNFMQELELFLLHKREEYIDCSALKDRQLGTILSETNNQTLFRDNPNLSVHALIQLLDERIKTRIHFLLSGYDKTIITKKTKEYAKYYAIKNPLPTIYQLYSEFLDTWSKEHSIDLELHIRQCFQREFDVYDIACLALIHYRIHQKSPNEEFGLIFLDEAQDFGIAIFYALKKLLPATYFTIMGDVSQNINYYTGLNDWYELQNLFLTGDKDKFLLLQKSYRNTIEISEYAGKILEKASSGRYKITPVIRHGVPVMEQHFWSDMEMAEHIATIVKDVTAKGYSTMAVICKDEREATYTRELLGHYTPVNSDKTDIFAQNQGDMITIMVLPIHLVKGLEFDTVILWNPDMVNGLNHPETAKLLYVAATRALHELHVLTC